MSVRIIDSPQFLLFLKQNNLHINYDFQYHPTCFVLNLSVSKNGTLEILRLLTEKVNQTVESRIPSIYQKKY